MDKKQIIKEINEAIKYLHQDESSGGNYNKGMNMLDDLRIKLSK